MTQDPAESGSSLPFVAPCRGLRATAPLAWLRRGWRDMRAAPRQSLAYGVAASYRVIGHPPFHQHMGIGEHSHWGVDLVLELNGEWHDEQSEGGETDPNSGGNVVFLAPGVRVVRDQISGHLTIGVPVISDMNGVQAEPDMRITAGISRSF